MLIHTCLPIFRARLIMSDDESYDPLCLGPSGELLLEVAPSPSSQRRSARLAPSQSDHQSLLSNLRAQGINPAPGLGLSQLQELASLIDFSDSAAASPVSAGETAHSAVAQRGRKRTRKSDPPRQKTGTSSRRLPASSTRGISTAAAASSPDHAGAAAAAGTAAPAPSYPAPIHAAAPMATVSFASPAPQDAVLSTLQSLVRSVQGIDSRLQLLEHRQDQALPQPHPMPTASTSAVPQSHSLASAIPAPSLGRPYIPFAANISPRLRQKILQGKDVNLVSLILPSPECDRKISSSDIGNAVIRSADPRLLRDLPIGEFLVAFGIFRDAVCSVFPDRRVELDAYLALIGDLNLRYGRNFFYQYHKAFSSKAALHIAQSNSRVNWSILDSEILLMIIGGSQAVTCRTCGNIGHYESLCPRLPFFPPAPPPVTPALPANPPATGTATDSRGRKVELFNNKPICNNFNEKVCTYPNCIFLHVCSACKDAHPRSVCPRRLIPARLARARQASRRGSHTS